MKGLFFCLVLFCSLNSSGQTDTLRVNGATFITKVRTELNEFDKRDTLLDLYRIENGISKHLLKHYVYRFSADCNNEFTDKGTYEIKNDSLIFHTEYLQKTGMDPIPERRKQIYKVSDAGKLLLVYDRQQERSGEWIVTNYK